jgi:separase
MTSLQAKAESVRSALVSTSTCTTATVTVLNELLSMKPSGQALESALNKKPTSKGSSVASSRSTRAPKSSTQDAARQKDGKLYRDELSPKEKAILATEVINATLKSLSSHGKAVPSVKPQPSSSDVKDSPRRRVLRRSTSLLQSPLEQRSLNRVSSSPNIGTRSSRSSSSASTTPSSYRAMAECARIAFACMRALQSSKTPCMMDMPSLQLENGMSALIGKLIMLGLDELALKELRILKRRLDGITKAPDKQAQNKNGRSGGVQASDTSGANETLAEIVDFEAPPTGGAALLLAITTQLQALKLLASSEKPNLITATLPKLCPDYPSSPVRLLLQSAKESSNQATKAARQLEMLSQLILSLCPNISTSDDAVAITPRLSTPPGVALQLQTLAFQSRVLWWKLCDHQGDIENDILVPFSRCLAAFTRRSQYLSLETYQCASQAFQTVQDLISNHSYFKSKGIKPPLQSIRKLLGSLAQDAGCFNDAVNWLKKVQETYSGTSVSEVQRCALAASLVALKLLTSASDPEVEELLMVVLEGLEGPLKGESLELDELLSELSKARRAAISRLYKQGPGPDSDAAGATSDGVRQMCESLVLLCPRFSIRYLGKPPDSGSAPKVIVRYEQRRQFVAKSGFHAIDSAMFLLKKFQSEGRLTWELMDSTLQDCLRLLERIERHVQDSTDERAPTATSYFVRMSQLYFTQHLNMRRDAEGPKDIQHVRPLRRSIECVSTRSILEKKAALTNSKLERLADICKTIGRYDEARETLITLQKELIESGILSRIATAGGSKPIREVWHESDDASMLARAITSLVRLELKSGSKLLQMPFYDVAWSPPEKGLVLEHLLDVLSRQPKESPVVQREIILELLAVYELRKFTVRRLRIIIPLLKLDPDQRRDLSDDMKNTLAISKVAAVLENSEDVGLISYLPHLQALVSTALELQEDHPRVDLLKPHLASWCSILENVKDYVALTKIVDEVPELLNHLLSVAHFLHMKGFSMMRVAVLRMITNLNEISQPDSCPDDLVLSYNSLGLQYLELGYSGKAGLSFDRAQSHASRNGVTPEALIQVQLSYAEYLLAIGNADKWYVGIFSSCLRPNADSLVARRPSCRLKLLPCSTPKYPALSRPQGIYSAKLI